MTLTVCSECWFAVQSLYVTVIYNVGRGKSPKSEVGSWKAEVGRPSSAFVVLDAGSREIPRNNELKHPSCCESLIPPADSL